MHNSRNTYKKTTTRTEQRPWYFTFFNFINELWIKRKKIFESNDKTHTHIHELMKKKIGANAVKLEVERYNSSYLLLLLTKFKGKSIYCPLNNLNHNNLFEWVTGFPFSLWFCCIMFTAEYTLQQSFCTPCENFVCSS